MNSGSQATAFLWIGHEQSLVQHTYAWLQRALVACQGCRVCSRCRLIEEQQYYAVTWIKPEGMYVLEDLQPLFKMISFQLEPGQRHIFVIQSADALSEVCANSLLKTVEEPPAGYHFIFLAECLEMIIPTLASRCVVRFIQEEGKAHQTSVLSSYFMQEGFQSPVAFLQELERLKPTEQVTTALLNTILQHWLLQVSKTYLQSSTKKRDYALRVIALLQQYLSHPLMPASSKLVWKNLFLQLKCR